MNRKKRILSILLCVAMLVTMIPGTALAADGSRTGASMEICSVTNTTQSSPVSLTRYAFGSIPRKVIPLLTWTM